MPQHRSIERIVLGRPQEGEHRSMWEILGLTPPEADKPGKLGQLAWATGVGMAKAGGELLALPGLLIPGSDPFERQAKATRELQTFGGLPGVAGELVGRAAIEGPLTYAGGAAIASKLPFLAKATTTGPRLKRLAAINAAFAPADFALGALSAEPGERLKRGLENVGLGFAGGVGFDILGRSIGKLGKSLFGQRKKAASELAETLAKEETESTAAQQVPERLLPESKRLLPGPRRLPPGRPQLPGPKRLPPGRTQKLLSSPEEQLELFPPERAAIPDPEAVQVGEEVMKSRLIKQDPELNDVPSEAVSTFARSEARVSRQGESVEVRDANGNLVDVAEKLVGGDERGFLNLQPIARFIKRNFATGGHIPEEAWKIISGRNFAINAHIQEMINLRRDLMRAAAKELGFSARFKLPDNIKTQLNDFLHGRSSVSVLPLSLQAPARKLRSHVDALSRELIKAGAVAGQLRATITKNMGIYMTRAYRIFEDPDWAKFAKEAPEMEPVRNKALAWLRSENPGATDDEIRAMFNDLLAVGKDDTPFTVLVKHRGLAKQLSILRERNVIAPELRALWGEITDPMATYAITVSRMAQLLETHKMLTRLREVGYGKIFFDKDNRGLAPEATHLIAGYGSKVLEPLNGLYTFPEIAQSIDDFLVGAPIGDFTRFWVRLNAATKFSKVVLSHVALIRNFLGNLQFALTQGHLKLWKMPQAFRPILAQYGVGDTPQWREYVKELQRLGIVNDATRPAELRYIMERAAKGSLDDFTSSLPTRIAKKATKFAEHTYRAADDVWKVFAFESELARYRPLQRQLGLSNDQLKEYVADIVRRTYPSASSIPRGIRWVSQFPIMGPFVTFPWSVYRTTVMTVHQILKELSNPITRRIGATRLFSTLLGGVGGMSSAGLASRYMLGITKEEDEAVRRNLPPWSKNASLLYLGRDENGNYSVVDLSFTDPYGYIKDPLIAALRGESPEKAALNAFKELMKPFTSPEILTTQTIKAMAFLNEAPANMPIEEKVAKVGEIMYAAFEPGTIMALRRMREATSNPGYPYQQRLDPDVEKLNMLTGVRVVKVDPLLNLQRFRAREYIEELEKARTIRLRVATLPEPVSSDELKRAHMLATLVEERAHDEFMKDIEAARLLGKKDVEVYQALKNSRKFNDIQIRQLLFGQRPFKVPGFEIEISDPLAPILLQRRLEMMRQSLNRFREQAIAGGR